MHRLVLTLLFINIISTKIIIQYNNSFVVNAVYHRLSKEIDPLTEHCISFNNTNCFLLTKTSYSKNISLLLQQNYAGYIFNHSNPEIAMTYNYNFINIR